MQPATLLQRTAANVTAEKWGSLFRKTTWCNKDWLKNFIFHFLPPLHSGNDFSRGYLTFDVFNNKTFFSIIQQTVMLYLPLLPVLEATPKPQKSLLLISYVLYFRSLSNSFVIIWNKFSFKFSLFFFIFSWFS